MIVIAQVICYNKKHTLKHAFIIARDIFTFLYFFLIKIEHYILMKNYDIITAKQLLYAHLRTPCAGAEISGLAVGDGKWPYYIMNEIHDIITAKQFLCAHLCTPCAGTITDARDLYICRVTR